MDERRTGWLLIAVLLVQLVAVAIQGARAGGSYTLAKAAGLRVLGPIERGVAVTAAAVVGTTDQVRQQRSLLAENHRLRREVEALELRLLRLGSVEQELERLGEAVRYATPVAGQIRAVDVVYADHSSWLRTLVLYCGAAPARVNQPVLSPAGLVGRVVTVAGRYAKVQLVTDRAAAVGAMVLRTRRQGVVRGGGEGGSDLVLDYLPLQSDVRPGDQVVTAGIDGIYPRGVPVGVVVSVEPGGQLFHKIRVAPVVDFGALDQVYLLDHAGPPPEAARAVPGARP